MEKQKYKGIEYLHLSISEQNRRSQEELNEQIARLQNALSQLEPFVDHRQSCPVRSSTESPKSEYCTCNINEVVSEVYEALSNLISN